MQKQMLYHDCTDLTDRTDKHGIRPKPVESMKSVLICGIRGKAFAFDVVLG
jgi:hypothetical protein